MEETNIMINDITQQLKAHVLLRLYTSEYCKDIGTVGLDHPHEPWSEEMLLVATKDMLAHFKNKRDQLTAPGLRAAAKRRLLDLYITQLTFDVEVVLAAAA